MNNIFSKEENENDKSIYINNIKEPIIIQYNRNANRNSMRGISQGVTKENSINNGYLDPFVTPMINNSEKTLEDIEMRKTYKTKPPLISSKLPAAFDIPKHKK